MLLPLLAACQEDMTRVVDTRLSADVSARVVAALAPVADRCTDGAAAVVAGGETTWAIAWGPGPSLATVYEWASVSKPLTATIALRLVEAGRFALETPLTSVAPAYATLVPAGQAPPTIAQLLSHTGGITREQHRHEPGMFMRAPPAPYRYSTNGYGILGDVIAAATGEPYAAAVAHLAATANAPSIGLRKDNWLAPGAHVQSDVGDLARFAAGLLDHTLLTEASTKRMWAGEVALPRDDVHLLPGSGAEAYGLGFVIAEEGDIVTHSGRNGARRAFVYLRPARSLGFVTFCTAREPEEVLMWWPVAAGVLDAAR